MNEEKEDQKGGLHSIPHWWGRRLPEFAITLLIQTCVRRGAAIPVRRAQ